MTLEMTTLAGFQFRDYSPEALADFMGELGLSQLDYWPWNRGEVSVAELRQLFVERGIEVVCVNVPSVEARVADPDAGPDQLGRFVERMQEAVTLGAGAVQIYTAVPIGDDLKETTSSLAKALEPITAEAARLGLLVTVENNLDQRGEDHRGLNPARSPTALAELFASSDTLRACYDPANFVAVGESPYSGTYELLQPWIANLHVKDCRAYEEADASEPTADKLLVDTVAGPFLPTVVGDGTVPWAAIVDRLSADGYGGGVTLDPFIADDQLESWCRDSVAAWRQLTTHTTVGADG